MKLSSNSIQNISILIADNLTGTGITNMLESCNFPADDFYLGYTKWRRLNQLFTEYQNTYNSQNHIYKVIEYFIDPRRFINDESTHESLLTNLNNILIFEGLSVDDSGHIVSTKKATTLRDAKIKVDDFRSKLLSLGIHPKITKYCTADILNKDFHSIIFESSKGLFEEIRKLSGSSKDGFNLIEESFTKNNPVLVFNNLSTKTEINEHDGYVFLLKSIVMMFRNPRAHTPKIYSIDSEADCLNILHIISFALYKLEKVQRVRTLNS